MPLAYEELSPATQERAQEYGDGTTDYDACNCSVISRVLADYPIRVALRRPSVAMMESAQDGLGIHSTRRSGYCHVSGVSR